MQAIRCGAITGVVRWCDSSAVERLQSRLETEHDLVITVWLPAAGTSAQCSHPIRHSLPREKLGYHSLHFVFHNSSNSIKSMSVKDAIYSIFSELIGLLISGNFSPASLPGWPCQTTLSTVEQSWGSLIPLTAGYLIISIRDAFFKKLGHFSYFYFFVKVVLEYFQPAPGRMKPISKRPPDAFSPTKHKVVTDWVALRQQTECPAGSRRVPRVPPCPAVSRDSRTPLHWHCSTAASVV